MTDLKNIQTTTSVLNGCHIEVEKYNYKDKLKSLNERQREAVFHLTGPCMVNSVPGSGKTTCLTMRFTKLVKSGVKPERIMCCTFTKKAAMEMKQRILGGTTKFGVNLSYVGTMHSLFLKILREHPRYYNSKMSICGRDYSKKKYIIMAAKDFRDKTESIDFRTVLYWIGWAKNELMSPEQLERYFEEQGDSSMPAGDGCAEICDYYEAYEYFKDQDSMVDYDDMIYQTWQMLGKYPEILEKWQDKFDYILVDEFQDINLGQWEIIKMLSRKHNNLFMVGDGNQSIYGFRGSHPEFLFNVSKEIPGIRVINMNVNYRSGEKIINLANVIAGNMKFQSAKIVGLGKKDSVEYEYYEDSQIEAQRVIGQIRNLLESGVDPNEIGVIYRVNACASQFEIGLALERIKYRSKSGDGFFDSKIVKDITSYLDVVENRNCVSSLSRIINVPNRYLGRAFKLKWEEYIDLGIDPKEALIKRYSYDYWERNASDLYYHLDMLSKLMFNPKKAIQYIRERMGYDEWLLTKCESEDHVVDKAREDLLNELEHIADKYDTIGALMKIVNAAKKFKSDTEEKAVTLMTIHGSKGLEFDHIFLVSLLEGIIPHSKANSKESREEERRMFYVGVTRARKGLYLSSFQSRRQKEGESSVSKFITECGDILL